MSEAQEQTAGGLRRELGLLQLVFYGSGTILGAGIFVVVGEVLVEAGRLAPLAYLVAAVVAITSALSFAEMAARVPTAGGPIDYLERAFGMRWLGSAAGFTLTIANTVSAATIVTGFVAYLSSFAAVPDWIATTALVLTLTGVAVAGMNESAWAMTVTTVIGILTLLAVLWALREGLLAAPGVVWDALSGAGPEGVAAVAGEARSGEAGGGAEIGGGLAGLFGGAILAVYSFIGFGDMAQTAEEVRDVKRTLPRAMMISLAIVFVFYLAVSGALVGAGSLGEIAQAEAPLVKAVELVGWPGLPVAVASLFVIVNGALTQIIAAARLLLDLARDGRGAPGFLARISGRTGTPVPATLFVGTVVLTLALTVPLKSLAEATSFAILLVFAGVNLALLRCKSLSQPEEVPDMWIGIPVVGAAASVLALAGQAFLTISGG